MSRTLRRLTCIGVFVAGLGGCAGLTPQQDAAWVAFHECQQGTGSAELQDLLVGGRVHYRTGDGREFGVMKACMEQRGYSCDLGVSIGSRPDTYCYPKAS
jgi:hypothetical protein